MSRLCSPPKDNLLRSLAQSWFRWLAVVLISSTPVTSGRAFAESREELSQAVDQLRDHVSGGRYDEALRQIEQLKWRLYDAQVSEKAPEVSGNTYRNYFFQFQISNPIEEWTIKKMSITDEIYRKKTRFLQPLVRIENPASPYGMKEYISFAAYDIGQSMENGLVSEEELRATALIRRFAEQQLREQKEGRLIEKGEETIQGCDAYRAVMEIETGTVKKAQTIQLYLYEPQKRFILLVTFLMYAENYPIYTSLLDAVLETLRLGPSFGNSPEFRVQSFMDIYLERSKS